MECWISFEYYLYLCLETVLPIILANGIGHRIKGSGKKIMIPEILKNRWQRAICKASASLSRSAVKAAKSPVVVVPKNHCNFTGFYKK